MEKEQPKKGLWQLLQEQSNATSIKPEDLTIERLGEVWAALRKQDEERRKRLDETHTPIEKITLEEIDKVIAEYGGEDKIPGGLQVMVKMAGGYYQWPILAVRQMLVAIKQEADKLYHEKSTSEKKTNQAEEESSES